MSDENTRLFHPLLGADLRTLVEVLRRNGPVPPRRWPHVGIALAGVALRWPSYAAERVYTARLRRRTEPMPPPVFIVGHWRSGTTHLYNVLSEDPRLGFVTPLATGMPWDFLGLVQVLRPLLVKALPSNRYVDRIPVNPDSPQEDEAALANMQGVSFYHGVYFPRRFEENFSRGVFFDGCSREEVRRWQDRFRHFLAKVWLAGDGRRLLVKNPVYTARVEMLREMYPGAKFIHIHRNPFEVYQSNRKFWPAMFRELALQSWEDVPVERVIRDAYPRMMDLVTSDMESLPPEAGVTVRYDALDRSPMETVERIYRVLDLEGFEEARPRFSAYLDEVSDYQKHRHRFPRETVETVRRHWGRYVDRWGYEVPA